jgi:hypothetical protein
LSRLSARVHVYVSHHAHIDRALQSSMYLYSTFVATRKVTLLCIVFEARGLASNARARVARFPSTPLDRFRAFARACTRHVPVISRNVFVIVTHKRRIVVSSSSRTGVVARRASAGVLKTPKTLRVREVRVYIGWLMRAPRRQCATITTTARRR